MMKCNKCASTKIRTRKNFSHGKKSKPTASHTCLACGSADVGVQETNRWTKKRRR